MYWYLFLTRNSRNPHKSKANLKRENYYVLHAVWIFFLEGDTHTLTSAYVKWISNLELRYDYDAYGSPILPIREQQPNGVRQTHGIVFHTRKSGIWMALENTTQYVVRVFWDRWADSFHTLQAHHEIL